MNEKNTPGASGQDTDPSDPLTLILAGIRGLSARLEVLEERLEHLDRDVLKAIDAESEAATDTEREPPRIPTLALTNDGRTLLSLHYVEGADLSDRKTWTGIFLTEAEAFDAFDAMSDAADDAAAHVGGRIIARTRKKSEPEGESGDGST
jgi:hypothetical protein